MADKKPIGGSLSESDIEFFRRELKSREPSQLTLITGTGDEAQKVLRDMIDAGASIQDGKLSENHESAVDGSKMRIEESIAQGSAMPGMTLRAKRGQMKRQSDRKKLIDLRIGDDMEEIDSVKEVRRVIDTSDLKKHIDETFQETDFNVKEFRTEDYPKNSQAYLIEAEFYCRKAREYRAKELAAAVQSQSYIERGIDKDTNITQQYDKVSEMYQKVERSYSEVFYYCIHEAVYWKIKAEIYNNSEQDKKRIQDPTKSSCCKIHSENDVTKYVYIPTDRRNIDKDNFDLELTKVGFGARNGVDNVMLIVKEFEECKEMNTLDMIERLSFYGGEFKDRGRVMVTEERRLIDDDQPDYFPETESKYFKNEARSDEYSDILKTLTNENRVFSFDKKRVDEPKMRTEMGEFFNQEREDHRSIDNFRKIQNSSKIVRHATKGVKYESELTKTGRKMHQNINTASNDFEFDKMRIDEAVVNRVMEAREDVTKLRIDEKEYVESEHNKETKRKLENEIETECEERRRDLEIEMEKRRLEREERERRRKEERDREREREERERQRKLEQEIESARKELEDIRSNGERMLNEIKEWLDSCDKKDHPKYLEVQTGYEKLVNMLKDPIFDGKDLEETLKGLKSLITETETLNMEVRGLTRKKEEAESEIPLALKAIGTIAVAIGGALIGAEVGADDQPDYFPETESKYFKNEARSDDYSDILKILTAENRIFSFDKKRVDEPKMRTEMGEFFNQEREDHRSIDNFRKIQNSSKIVYRATEGVKYTSKLTKTGMNVYRNMYTATKGVDIQVDKRMIDQVWEARGYVNKLRIEEMQYVEGRRRIETGRRHGIQMEKQRVEQAEANKRLEEERRRNLEIEMEKRRQEQAERDRRREEEREREREREKREKDRKLMQEIESRNGELEKIRRNGDAQLGDVKEWLDECEKKDHPKYLEVKHRYEELVNMVQQPLSDDFNLERKLRKLNGLIVKGQTRNMDVRKLRRDQVDAEAVIATLIEGAVVVVWGGVGDVGGAVAGAGLGATVGLISGPAGVTVGRAGVAGAVGALFPWW